MNLLLINLLLIVIVQILARRHVNKTIIDLYRMDFMMEMLNNNSPFKIPYLKLKGNVDLVDNDYDNETVQYYLYTQDAPYTSKLINDALDLVNPKLRVKLLVHGWTEHYYVEWCKNLTEAYLTKGEYNVIILDWSSKGDANYLSASMAIKPVGNLIAQYIVYKLNKKAKVPLKNIHMISHSLGCHLAGIIGQYVYKIANRKVGRITALDPAAPYFDFVTLGDDDKLSRDDADVVDIVHTDAGWLGVRNSIGTVDFFPNGGRAYQPGCSLLRLDIKYEDLFCSHASSHVYFQKSITSGNLTAMKCDSWDKFAQNQCDQNTTIPFGDDMPTNVNGRFFLSITK